MGDVIRPQLPSIEQIVGELAEFDITHVGITSADVLGRARSELHDRIDRGLTDSMQFTFKNPERSTDPRAAMPGAKSVIVAARPYLTDHDPEPAAGLRARIGRYAWVDHYATLRTGLRQVGRQIKAAGHRAVAFADDNSMVDRAIAHRAGIGWFGKNANLLVPGAGSFFVLGSLVTTAPYEPTGAPVADGCGPCTRCLDGCPTGAIIEPGVIDAARCLSWVLQKPGTIDPVFREVIHDRIYGCDDCQDVCPITVRLGQRSTVPLPPDAIAWADVHWILTASDADIEARHGQWYIADRNMRWLRRNALVVLGNVAEPSSTTAVELIARYRSSGDPILAEHAAWAADRLVSRS